MCSENTISLDGCVYRETSGWMELVDYEGDRETVTVPEKINGKPVLVTESAFALKENLRRLVFEKDVHFEIVPSDPFWPFSYCPSLASVTLPNHLKEMFKYRFPPIKGCPDLKEVVTYPDNPDCITKDGLFYLRTEGEDGLSAAYCFCDSEEITIPGNVDGEPVRAVDLGAFFGCRELKHLVIGEGITEVSGHFHGAVRTLQLPDSCSEIRTGLILSARMADHFEGFVIGPDHPAMMEENGFIYDRSGKTLLYAPNGAEAVRVKEGVKTIADTAFVCHKELKAVFLPESVEKIERGAFHNCANLYYVLVHAGTEMEGGSFSKMGREPLFCLFTPEGEMLPLPEDTLMAKPAGRLEPRPSDEELLQMHNDICRMGFEEFNRHPQKPWWLQHLDREW